VHEVAEDGDLPVGDAAVDLVSARHPTAVRWDEVARTLRPGGRFLCQGVGSGSNRELYEALLGPQPLPDPPAAARAADAARAAGLDVVDLREQAPRVEFGDVGAVVHFLRKVVWTVPDFTVERYRDRLRAAHEAIEREGRFLAHSQRYLIEARRPG
jgi:SAM-dependent methyltransferase